MPAPAFPTTLEGISAAFLSTVLGEAIAEVRVEPIVSQGALSAAARLRLTAADSEASREDGGRSLFAKCAHPSEEIRRIGLQTGMYLKEIRFYEVFGQTPDLPLPRCHFAGYDEATGAFLLLLEDMAGSRTGNMFGSDVADVARVIEELPAFHAAWWNDPSLEEHPWLWRLDRPPVIEAFQGMLRTTAPQTIERFGIDGEFRETAELVAAQLPRFARLWSDRAVTLAHGDLHLQQAFFPTEAGGRFALFDWQTVMVANPGTDLAKVLTADLSAADRRAHERELVARYHSGLLIHGVDAYSLEDCWLDYRLGQIWHLVMMLNAGSVADVDAIDRAARASGTTASEFVGRTGAALADLEVAALLD